jgi:ubiquitin-protein ligase
MSDENREKRLWQEVETLRGLKKQSSIFDFEFSGDPPDKFIVTFSGKGIGRPNGSDSEPEVVELHQIQIQMAYLYPAREPDLKWLTPIFHPNLSNSGFVDLEDIGLVWEENLSIEIICERLWDVIRLAHVDLNGSSQYTARDWYRNKCAFKLPLDPRPLRDHSIARQSNVVQYVRRTEKKSRSAIVKQQDRDVLYIGGEERSPALPAQPLPMQQRPVQLDSAKEHSTDESPIEFPASPIPPSTKSPTNRSDDLPSNPSRNDDDIMFID